MLQVKRLTISLLLVLGLIMSVTSMAQRVNVGQGGLVNVVVVDLVDVGDVTILKNVGIGVAVNAALALCPTIAVGNVGILAQQVAKQDVTTVCEVEGGDLDGGTVQIIR
jgi:hypothetical protein